MGKAKTTVYIEEDLLRAARVHAARKGMRDYEVFEAALRAYLGFDVLSRVWEHAGMDPDEAMELVDREVHAVRRERAKRRRR